MKPEKTDETLIVEPQSEKTVPKFLKAFKSLTVLSFRTLWIGMLFNVASMQIDIVARSWLAYNLSGSALVLGVVAMSRGLPQIIFSPLGGVAADRFNKRKVLIISQTILCALALTNALLVQMGAIKVWHLIATSLLQGIAFPFTMPSRQALIPQLVSGENLPNALAMDSAGRNLNRVLAPSVAGILIAWDPFVAFYSVAALSLLSALTLLQLPATASTVNPSRSAMQQMLFGFRYILSRRRLLVLIGMAFLANILGMPFQQMLPVFQASVLNVGPEKLGFMYAAVGIGALVGSLAVAFRSDDPRRQRYQMAAGVGFGALLIPFAFSKHLGLSLAMLIMIGLCSEIFATINRMLVLLNTDSRFYGRVMGTYAITFSLMPLASLPMGALVDAVGAPDTIAAFGLLLALVILIASFILPRIWNKDTEPKPGEI